MQYPEGESYASFMRDAFSRDGSRLQEKIKWKLYCTAISSCRGNDIIWEVIFQRITDDDQSLKVYLGVYLPGGGGTDAFDI